MLASEKIAVIGLGYVGLPLAVALSKHFPVIGYDIDEKRIEELKVGKDRTLEVDEASLRSSPINLTSQLEDIKGYNIFIVTVPTPVTSDNQPDLEPLRHASQDLAKILSYGNIVVYESTVYPGVTEDFCGPILEKGSNLVAGKDFFLGYSPERINPGDKEHTVEKINKVVSGQNNEVANRLAKIYGTINNNNIFIAKNIKSAEAAKVIENTQRDINIAFINEITAIFNKMDISIYDVLDAASTKWNFLKFYPGLVGGHCIGVDPYYLAQAALDLGHEPEVILSGRRINESMPMTIAQSIDQAFRQYDLELDAKILILGLTFKEDVPDLRNTKVVSLVNSLNTLGYQRIVLHDPLADVEDVQNLFGISLHSTLDHLHDFDAVIGVVSHKGYHDFECSTFQTLIRPEGVIIDLKGMWRHKNLPHDRYYWSL